MPAVRVALLVAFEFVFEELFRAGGLEPPRLFLGRCVGMFV